MGEFWIDHLGVRHEVVMGDHVAPAAVRPPSEHEVARRFAAEQAERLRYCHATRAWFVWDGAVWRQDTTGVALERARETAYALVADATSAATSRTFVGRLFIAHVERLARGDPALAVDAAAWDDDPLLLGTPDGPIDLATGLAAPAEPRDGLRRATAVAPAGDAACPAWTRFLQDALGGDACAFVQRFLGYALTGSVAEQAMLFCCGPGGTGKSVFLNSVLHVLGEYARPAPLTLLTVNADRRPVDLAALRGTRLVVVAESERGRRWDERRLKLLTGGDPVIAAGGHFTPGFKLIVTGNQPPRLDVVDEAMRRRLHIVPFRHRPAVPDRDLPAKLRAEAPGILAWMIEGCRAWQAQGLGRCSAVAQATADYFAAEDALGLFLAERCEGAPDDATKATASGALYRAWCYWAAEAGEEAGSQRAFAEALAARGFRRERTEATRLYRGLALRDGSAPTARENNA